MDQPSAELHARQIVAQKLGRFAELINAETEDGKYEILAQLLSTEPESKKSASSSPAPAESRQSLLDYDT